MLTVLSFALLPGPLQGPLPIQRRSAPPHLQLFGEGGGIAGKRKLSSDMPAEGASAPSTASWPFFSSETPQWQVDIAEKIQNVAQTNIDNAMAVTTAAKARVEATQAAAIE